MNNKNITSLILAAGFSSRMGKFKPLLDYEGKSFIQNVAEKVAAVSDKIIIVTGFNSAAIVEHLENRLENKVLLKIDFVFNERFESGMFSSLKKGISNAGNPDWILYHFVDQPLLHEEFYLSFVKEVESGFDLIQPTHKGKKGHPIILGGKIIESIKSADLDKTLKILLEETEFSTKMWECAFPEVLKDFDLPEDLSDGGIKL
ncbi:MAG: nucleotidyltransferase family protein [Chlorobi bacterium]|nr:nucleotidyltransferase family protein [Chlorobiota bacterium]